MQNYFSNAILYDKTKCPKLPQGKKYISYSLIAKFAKSPKEFLNFILTGQQITTYHHLLGSVIHTACLEPHKVNEKYRIQAKTDQSITNAQSGRPKISLLDLSIAFLIKKNINPLLQPLMQRFQETFFEVTIVADHEFEQKKTQFKGVIDILLISENEVLIVDVKTVTRIEDFVKNYKASFYYLQAELYKQMIQQLYPDKNIKFQFLLIEKKNDLNYILRAYTEDHSATLFKYFKNMLIFSENNNIIEKLLL